MSLPMARACGAAAAETPTTDAVTAAAAIAFLNTRVPFLGTWFWGLGLRGPGSLNAGTEVPVPRSSLINSEQRSWFFRFTPTGGAADMPRTASGQALPPPAGTLPHTLPRLSA
ncbi:hypothetical protein SCWH03_26600 [Streptomyces pacificus]|uniref:Uncharacterized protein n=1 Tax=Streptomyces pacificus TaxID=2705029 RepID=A0A6A0AU48_9ACTN|nr:hypothetical protein SCWH03_26600 [Streptomyces pacificus]